VACTPSPAWHEPGGVTGGVGGVLATRFNSWQLLASPGTPSYPWGPLGQGWGTPQAWGGAREGWQQAWAPVGASLAMGWGCWVWPKPMSLHLWLEMSSQVNSFQLLAKFTDPSHMTPPLPCGLHKVHRTPPSSWMGVDTTCLTCPLGGSVLAAFLATTTHFRGIYLGHP
jgi:hypothetical protein